MWCRLLLVDGAIRLGAPVVRDCRIGIRALRTNRVASNGQLSFAQGVEHAQLLSNRPGCELPTVRLLAGKNAWEVVWHGET